MFIRFFVICCILLTAKSKDLPDQKDVPEDGSPMLQMLDAMQQALTGGGSYNRTFYYELRNCMDLFDPRLTKAQDLAWQGIINYWKERNNFSGDYWGSSKTSYIEYNVSTTNLDGMKIYEPCDYASNVAYYHDVTEFCSKMKSGSNFNIPGPYVRSLGNVFSFLSMGSAFMHGSNTLLGKYQDVYTLRAMAYLMHQSSLASLDLPSPILTDLQETKRSKTSLEIVESLMQMYLNEDVSVWTEMTLELDIPDYFLTFAGIITTSISIGLDEQTVDYILPIIAKLFNMPGDLRKFLFEKYVPEMRAALKGKHFDYPTRVHFLGNALGSSIKLIYAFLWQERILTKNSFFLDPLVNSVGWELLPRINKIANQFTSFDHYAKDFQRGRNVYPGQEWCNEKIPHAKWHVESGVGLLDLVYLCDEMYKLLSD